MVVVVVVVALAANVEAVAVGGTSVADAWPKNDGAGFDVNEKPAVGDDDAAGKGKATLVVGKATFVVDDAITADASMSLSCSSFSVSFSASFSVSFSVLATSSSSL